MFVIVHSFYQNDRKNHMRIIKIFIILLTTLLPLTGLYANTVAVLLNMPCDATIKEEFDQWEQSSQIKQMFHPIVRFSCTSGDNFPFKENIISQLHQIYAQKPETILYFIYGIENKDNKLIDYNREEIKEELFTINDQYIAPNIVIIDINRSFSRYNYQFSTQSTANVYRGALLSEAMLKTVRQKLNTTNPPFSINFLTNVCNISLIPLTNTTSSLLPKPVSSNSQMFFMTYTKTDPDTWEQKTVIYHIVSQDDFENYHVNTFPYPVENVLCMDFNSPYYYTFSRQQGHRFEVFEKVSGKRLCAKPISAQPGLYDLNKLSYEYHYSSITALAFGLPNNHLGLFQDNKGMISFLEINCMDYQIDAITIDIDNTDTENTDESLVYIHNNQLRMRPIKDNSTTIIGDKVIARDARLANMYGANLIWRGPHAIILSKNRGLFWNGKTHQLESLYTSGEVHVHFVDTFNSGNGRFFGFVWSASEIKENQKKYYVRIGRENNQKRIEMLDITNQIKSIITNPGQSMVPSLYLKDKGKLLTNLYGAIIYQSDSQKTIVKHIEISLRNNKVKVISTHEFPATNLQYNVKVIDPKGKKIIVNFDLDNNKIKGQQLFSFYKVNQESN